MSEIYYGSSFGWEPKSYDMSYIKTGAKGRFVKKTDWTSGCIGCISTIGILLFLVLGIIGALAIFNQPSYPIH